MDGIYIRDGCMSTRKRRKNGGKIAWRILPEIGAMDIRRHPHDLRFAYFHSFISGMFRFTLATQ